MAFFLNKVEMAGIVGQSKVMTAGEKSVARFSLAINYAYKDREGCPVIETTWVSCVAWESKGIAELDTIMKGTKVRLCGRIRCVRYTDSSGADRTATEIVVNSLEIIPAEEPMEFETP